MLVQPREKAMRDVGTLPKLPEAGPCSPSVAEGTDLTWVLDLTGRPG